ncbi:MAG: hypothetical protein DRQ63_02920 [Gammaproteobacteria bacterium]|nr:MAG: hypothetical protein DRQ63_02920 [Gammaproteobacteria bacterium]
MWPGFVIACMATGTVRLECSIAPGNKFRVALVAFCAPQVAAVVLGFIRQGGVTIIGRCPGVRHVARVAVFRSTEVIRVLSGRNNAVVTG